MLKLAAVRSRSRLDNVLDLHKVLNLSLQPILGAHDLGNDASRKHLIELKLAGIPN